MRKILLLFIALYFFVGLYSCKTSHHSKSSSQTQSSQEGDRDKKTKELLAEAYSYKSTKYKSGGTDKNGMDCSGLVFTSFKKIGISLPRVSYEQSKVGNPVKNDEAEKGDLIFFETSGKAKGINHVGIVTKKEADGTLNFIHATLKSGVTENNLAEEYYRKAFVKIMRVY